MNCKVIHPPDQYGMFEISALLKNPLYKPPHPLPFYPSHFPILPRLTCHLSFLSGVLTMLCCPPLPLPLVPFCPPPTDLPGPSGDPLKGGEDGTDVEEGD